MVKVPRIATKTASMRQKCRVKRQKSLRCDSNKSDLLFVCLFLHFLSDGPLWKELMRRAFQYFVATFGKGSSFSNSVWRKFSKLCPSKTGGWEQFVVFLRELNKLAQETLATQP